MSISTLISCNLNDESVRKVLKTQLRYQICNGLKLQSTKETVLQFTRKQLLDSEMFNLHYSRDVSGLAKKIKVQDMKVNFHGTFYDSSLLWPRHRPIQILGPSTARPTARQLCLSIAAEALQLQDLEKLS